jgi:hypothetical protein
MENKNTDKSKLDGSMVIGKNYINQYNPPLNGMLIEGNVGIGKTNPTTTLDVSGNIKLNGVDVLSSGDNISELTNNSGYITALSSSLTSKAPLESPSFTGTPTAQTASSGTNTDQLATTAFVKTAVNDLIGGAPGALDTLNELAAALEDDANFASTVTASLSGKQDSITSSSRLNADLIHDGTITNTEFGYLNGVTSSIQTQLDAKLDSGANISELNNDSEYVTDLSLTHLLAGKQNGITGAASTITTNLLTTNRVLISSDSGKVKVSSIYASELEYLDGATGSIQSQLNGKQATIADGDLTIAKTSGLQAALDAKQASIGAGDLTIANTSGLQTALDAKLDSAANISSFTNDSGYITNTLGGLSTQTDFTFSSYGTQNDVATNWGKQFIFRNIANGSGGSFAMIRGTSSSAAIRIMNDTDVIFFGAKIEGGKVGINVTGTPSAKLHVNGNTIMGSVGDNYGQDALLTLGGAANAEYNTTDKVKLLIANGNNDGSSPYDILCKDENNYTNFFLKGPVTQGGDDGIMYMKGKIGIGTTSPKISLHAYGYTSGAALSNYVVDSGHGAHISNDDGGAWIRPDGQISGSGAWEWSDIDSDNNLVTHVFGGPVYASNLDSSVRYSILSSWNLVIDNGCSLIISSDKRIKVNIKDVPDDLALYQLRRIPCRYYRYKDWKIRGKTKTIGFIAQEVREILPMAVKVRPSIIPNIYHQLNNENIIWEEITDSNNNIVYKLRCKEEIKTKLRNYDAINEEDKYYNLENLDVSGVKFKFIVNQGNAQYEEEREIIGNSDDSFTFKEKWKHVFCYGYEVQDFHSLDKQKLFALNFSATQEIDRIQQEEVGKLAEQTARITELETHVQTLESQLESVLARLSALESSSST